MTQLVPFERMQERVGEQIVACRVPSNSAEIALVTHLVRHERLQGRVGEQFVDFLVPRIMEVQEEFGVRFNTVHAGAVLGPVVVEMVYERVAFDAVCKPWPGLGSCAILGGVSSKRWDTHAWRYAQFLEVRLRRDELRTRVIDDRFMKSWRWHTQRRFRMTVFASPRRCTFLGVRHQGWTWGFNMSVHNEWVA